MVLSRPLYGRRLVDTLLVTFGLSLVLFQLAVNIFGTTSPGISTPFGAGTIGASWAALFLAHGLEVVVSDPAADAEALTRARVAAAWPVLAELGRVAAGATPDNLRFEPDRTIELVEGAHVAEPNVYYSPGTGKYVALASVR